ncbi:MAG: flagellin [Candidatus Latescibacterota bacterium]|nr:flagellin [Candidatus Latescibacterota bacterium]MEE2728538.1 flagellin [Candidatus Latescibacterota bacterium]
MPIRLGSNIASINAQRQLNTNSSEFTKRVERLSSGLRINRGADDAAGLSVSEGMRSEILGMRQGVRNAEQGISLIQLAEGSLNEVSNMLRRMRELAVQSANSTINDSNRENLSAEFNMLSAEIDRIAVSTTYNDQVLLTGFGNTVSQNSEISTALDGFSGVREIGISGAVPGTYEFTDSNSDDSQITLAVTLPDGTELKQSIDMGASLDRDGGQNVVATGTTWVANFDRLGVQVTLVGPNVDNFNTFKSTVEDGGVGGTVVIGNETVTINAGESLENIATKLDETLSLLDPAGSATYDEAFGELRVNSGGNEILSNPEGLLGLVNANAYIDGRLDGKQIVVSEATGGVLQVGPNNEASNRIALNIGDMRATGNELNLSGISVSNLESSRNSISRIDNAILVVTRQRGDLGAIQNRLQFTTGNLGNAIENLTAAESAIRDADVAEEISAFTRNQILTQAATSMITQANSLPQSALALLQ